jgi:hypothetical protein
LNMNGFKITNMAAATMPGDAVRYEQIGAFALTQGVAASGSNADITSLSALTSINGGQIAGLRNRIINGGMQIDQRNTGAAITPTSSAFTVDRFAGLITQASKLTFQQVADAPAGLKSSLKVTVASQYSPSATDTFALQQAIEGQNIIDFGFGTASPATVTLSFWVKGSVAGTYGLCLNSSNSGRQYIGTVSVTSSWVRQTITLVGDTTGTYATDNTVGLYLQFDLGSGTNYNGTAGAWQNGAQLRRTSGCVTFVNQAAGATLNITGVQLELGSVATTFEQRPYGLELALCQRYFCKTYDSGYAPGATGSAPGFLRTRAYSGTSGSSYGAYVWTFPTSMRQTPTMNIYNPSTGAVNQWQNVDTPGSAVADVSTTSQSSVAVESFALIPNNTYLFHLTASSEM